ncbi:MAG: hypothetical protein LBH65_04650 [Desulfovibrio sp.]|nr:hypothetical protein [Desulfovibrio sp.]
MKVQTRGGGKWKAALAAYCAQNAEVRVGILAGASYSGETSTLPVAAIAAVHEFGAANIPARSFMRSTLQQKREEWISAAAWLLRANPGDVRGMLAMVGETAAKDMQAAIEAGIGPPLKPATVKAKLRRKGGKGRPDLPLVDTGTMQEAISYEVLP